MSFTVSSNKKHNFMADNFIERHRAEYEKKKGEWLKKKSHSPKHISSAEICRRRMTRECDD